MDLLSDPEYGSVKWVRILRKVHKPLTFLCYIGAIVWFFMLGNKAFNNETYFSENALLPGLVTNEFNTEQAAKQYYNELLKELEDKYEDSDQIPVPWLIGKMSQLNLEVYTHNFTLDYPLGQGQVFYGTNVYGILRAPRTASLEALVVSAPHRSVSSHQKGTAAGIALMLAFAQFARPQKYWAKDIIFLVTEHEQLGMQAWLEAYHGIVSQTETLYSSMGSFWKHTPYDLGSLGFEFLKGSDHKKCLNPGKLKGRSGSIQAAINLEFHSPMIKYIEVKVEGLNGQLPNLDLVNLVHKLCIKSSIHHSYKNSYSWIRTRNKVEEWTNSIWTMLGMVSAQVAGVPNGNHGLYHRFGIEAVTLEGRDANDPAGVPPKVHALSFVNFYKLGNALESILRSLNNLLERFHQSYFFYLLTGTNRFISIGQYMPSLCLLCVAMLLRSLALWVSIQQSEEVSDEKITNSENTEPSEGTKEQSQNNGDKKLQECREESDMSIVNIGANYLLVHLLGYAVMNAPLAFSKLGYIYFSQSTQTSVFYGLIAASVFLVAVTPFLPKILRTRMTMDEWSLVNVLLLIELSTVCLTVGMHNFSLGLALGVIYTPLALIVSVVTKNDHKRSKLSEVILTCKRLLCLLLHPLSVVTLGMMAYSAYLYPEERFMEIATRGLDAAMEATMFAIVDSLYHDYAHHIPHLSSSSLATQDSTLLPTLTGRESEIAANVGGVGAVFMYQYTHRKKYIVGLNILYVAF
ncbi:Glycosylphosphatidylinositol anchor attachment 1 protein [Eumeta japonica]|uniref:Glycosylphosphatidylinositol anchor attachment 1 protein n=1 Tax=Eumeta variegata TaxID=151549 RepID=A0A4C1YP51_EUMVA|nr:Glycosylphosphatidylinositol anchor attachment 1 protein [Eumeta japonica]